MSNLEVLKFKYQIAKDKLILWSAGLSGSFFGIFNFDNSLEKIALSIAFIFSFIGFLANLKRIGKISKELEKLKG